MSDDQVARIEMALKDQVARIELVVNGLTATLNERCAMRQVALDKNASDTNKAFDKIRSVEKMVYGQNAILAKWSTGSAIGSAVFTAAAIKFFIG